MHLLKFISYTSSGSCQAVFHKHEDAMAHYERAKQTRDEWAESNRNNDVPLISFDVTDDFGLTYSVNLANMVLVVTSAEANAKCNEAIRLAAEAAEQKFGAGKSLGFMSE